MAIAVVGSSSQAVTTAALTLVLTCPAGTSAGDVMVAATTMGNQAATITAPSGWTQAPGANINNGGTSTDIREVAYYRVADAGDVAGSTTYTWTWGTACTSGGGIVVYSGVDTTTPDDTTTASTAQAAGAITIPAVTTTVDGCMVLACAGANANTGVFSATPAGYAVEMNVGGRRTNICDVAQAAAGASGTANFQQANGMAGVQFALRPPAAAPPAGDLAPYFEVTEVVWG